MTSSAWRGWVNAADEGVFKFERLVAAENEEEGAPDDPRESTDQTKDYVEGVHIPLELVLHS